MDSPVLTWRQPGARCVPQVLNLKARTATRIFQTEGRLTETSSLRTIHEIGGAYNYLVTPLFLAVFGHRIYCNLEYPGRSLPNDQAPASGGRFAAGISWRPQLALSKPPLVTASLMEVNLPHQDAAGDRFSDVRRRPVKEILAYQHSFLSVEIIGGFIRHFGNLLEVTARTRFGRRDAANRRNALNALGCTERACASCCLCSKQ